MRRHQSAITECPIAAEITDEELPLRVHSRSQQVLASHRWPSAQLLSAEQVNPV